MELLKKLRIDTNRSLWLINAPDDCMPYFEELQPKKRLGKDKPALQVVVFVYDSKELADYVHKLSDYVAHETLLWICYPKKSGAYTSDLILMESWDVVFNAGYRTQTSVSIDYNWTGMRVTNAPRTKPSDRDVPMAERTDEGIDYVNRKVTLPPDAGAAIAKHKGLKEYFYNQSFTCKKEYVLAINDAKKEDTRRRRIGKMIEMLQEKMNAGKCK